jgi:hypothetical protein
MGKKDKAEELVTGLQIIEPLENVPADVSGRFQETLARLALQESQTKSKKNWLSGGNQFALAASFTLVFALGAVFTINSGENAGNSIDVNQNQTSNAATDNNVKDDQLLYSGSEGSIPETSNSPIINSNSAHDYATIPVGLHKTLGVGATWNSAERLEPSTAECLKNLQLSGSTNLIDKGFLNKKAVTAIWAPIGTGSWNVYLVDTKCSVIDKKFVQS